LACAKKLVALTLHLSQTLQSIDLDFSAALTEIDEVRQTIFAWRSGTEEWIGHDLAVYRQGETLCSMRQKNKKKLTHEVRVYSKIKKTFTQINK